MPAHARGRVRRIALCLAALALLSGHARADRVTLKDGTTHSGRKIGETGAAIGLKTDRGKLILVRKSDILTYTRGAAPARATAERPKPSRSRGRATSGAPLITIRPSEIARSEHRGFSYKCTLRGGGICAGDAPVARQRSRLEVLENGRPLGPAHTLHVEIARQGKGRFSHWLRALYFSASDNSDPRHNGRTYAVRLGPAKAKKSAQGARVARRRSSGVRRQRVVVARRAGRPPARRPTTATAKPAAADKGYEDAGWLKGHPVFAFIMGGVYALLSPIWALKRLCGHDFFPGNAPFSFYLGFWCSAAFCLCGAYMAAASGKSTGTGARPADDTQTQGKAKSLAEDPAMTAYRREQLTNHYRELTGRDDIHI